MGKRRISLATISGHSWWEIGDPLASPNPLPGYRMDLSVSPGDLPGCRVVAIPSGAVTALAISGPAVIPTICSNEETNPVSFKISITANGPATVTYHLECMPKTKPFCSCTLIMPPWRLHPLHPNRESRWHFPDRLRRFHYQIDCDQTQCPDAQASWSVWGTDQDEAIQ